MNSYIKNSRKTFAKLIESIDFHIKRFVNKKEVYVVVDKRERGGWMQRVYNKSAFVIKINFAT